MKVAVPSPPRALWLAQVKAAVMAASGLPPPQLLFMICTLAHCRCPSRVRPAA